jgi:sensor histidine kinase YesM
MINRTPPLFQNATELPPIIRYVVKNRWIYHAIFWGLFTGVSLFSDWSYMITSYINLVSLFASLFIVMLGSYAQAWWLMPRFLYEKKYFIFILGNVGVYFVQVVIAYQFNIYIYLENKAYFDSLTTTPTNWDEISCFTGTSIFVFYLFFVPSVKLLKDIYLHQQAQQKLEKDTIERDLKFLKGQLSPHLLFNTLNNLYGLSLQKSDLLPPLMLRLSEVMRYSLYETNQVFVPVNQEVEYLKNYIELEKLRIGNEVKLNVHFQEDATRQIQIAPMLLVVFIENAFKHSRHAPKSERFIKMNLTYNQKEINFTIENSFNNSHNYQDQNSGLGLELTKRRLDLLYQNNYTLNIDNQNNVYKIDLKMV